MAFEAKGEGAKTRIDGGTERDQLLERLQSLRTILPAMAEELASARRQAASLRVENRRLVEEVRRLQTTQRTRPALARQPIAAGL